MSMKPTECEVAYIPRKLLEYLLSLRISPLITQSVNELVDQAVLYTEVLNRDETTYRTYFTKSESRLSMTSLRLSKNKVNDLKRIQLMIGHASGINLSMSDVLVGAIIHQLRDLDSPYWKVSEEGLYGFGVQHLYYYQWKLQKPDEFIVARKFLSDFINKKENWKTVLSRP